VACVRLAFLDQPRPIAFAHRGGAAHRPENSWPAFEHAVGLGYTYLETDARATADGVLVGFHDRTLDRVTDARGKVSALRYRDVAAARIGGTEPIPLIEDLLGAWPGARFNIDLKDTGAIGPLAQVLRRTAAWDRVCITSFSARRLRAARRLLDRPVCMALSPAGITAMRLAGPHPVRRFGQVLAGRLALLGVGCAQVPARIATAAFLHGAHALGLQVHVWTLNRRHEMERALGLGADGIMTDEIAMLRALLTERGQWQPGPREAGGAG